MNISNITAKTKVVDAEPKMGNISMQMHIKARDTAQLRKKVWFNNKSHTPFQKCEEWNNLQLRIGYGTDN